jgi:hypothetical protein
MAAEQTSGESSKARLIARDFARSLLLALSIGVLTSVALGTAVLLLAQSSSEAVVTSPADR